MERKQYHAPAVSESKTTLRASILVGSTPTPPVKDGDPINGVSGGQTSGKDFTFE